MRSAFTGAFAPYICGLIEKKQALGYDYHGSACILRTFDEFCREQFPNETCLTAELAMKWAEQFKTEKNLSRLNRVSVIRELAKYMNSVGEQAYLLPLQLTKKSGRHMLRLQLASSLGSVNSYLPPGAVCFAYKIRERSNPWKQRRISAE